MFNTQDSVPKIERSKHRSELVRNYAEAGAAGAVLYGGLRTANAMKKLGKAAESGKAAAEAWQKSAPAQWKIFSKIRKVFKMGSRISLIQFASGDIFRKYVSDSPWVSDPTGRTLSKAATARKPSKLRKGDLSYQRANENFNKSAMRDAVISTNITGEHTDYLKKEARLKADHAASRRGVQVPLVRVEGPVSNVRAYKKGTKVSVAGRQVKVRPGSKVATERMLTPGAAMLDLRRKYRKGVGNASGFQIKAGGQRMKVRGAMHEELAGVRDIIQGIRKHRGTLPQPLSESEMREIKSRRPEWTAANKEIAPSHIPEKWEPGPHFKIAGKDITQKEYREYMPELKKDLQSQVESEVARRARISNQMNVALRGRAAKNIAAGRKELKLEPYSPGKMDQQVRKALHGIYAPTAPEGTHRENIAGILGLKKTSHLDRIRDRQMDLGRWSTTSVGEKAIGKEIIKSGKLFAPKAAEGTVKTTPYPRLDRLSKKLGPVGRYLGKKLLKFSALGDASLKAYVHGTSALERLEAKLRRSGRKLARKYPMAASAAKGYAKGLIVPVPGSAEAGAAVGVASHLIKKHPAVREAGVRRVMRKVENRPPVRMSAIYFERKKKSFLEKAQSSEGYREKIWTNIRRGQRVIKDIGLPKTRTGKVVDERGRTRDPEWRKPWVAKAAGVAVIGATLGSKYLRPTLRTGLASVLNVARKTPFKTAASARTYASEQGAKVPAVSRAFTRTRKNIKGYVSEVSAVKESLAKKHIPSQEKTVAESAEKRIKREEHEKNVAQIRKIMEEGGSFSAKGTTHRFAQTVPDWDIRDARGKSARIYAPGSQTRTRREKKWHERKANRDLLASILLPAAAVSGAGSIYGGTKISDIIKRRSEPKMRPAGRFGGYHGNVANVVESDLKNVAKSVVKKTWRDAFLSDMRRPINFDMDPDKKAWLHDTITGSLEGGVGFVGTERLLDKLSKNSEGFAKAFKNPWVRGGTAVVTGGITTGTLGYGLNRLVRKKKAAARVKDVGPVAGDTPGSSSELSSRLRAITFKVVDNPLYPKHKSAVKNVRISGITSHQNHVDEKIVEKYRKKPGRALPTLHKVGKKYYVEDGNHRIVAKMLNGAKTVRARVMTKLSSRPQLIRFDSGGYSAPYPPKKGKRITVAQDRYRKNIREKEIDRHESNLTKSAIFGGALGAAIKHTPKAAAIGALGGLGIQAGLIAANRHRKDVWGDSSIATRREERLPYQAAAVGAGALISHKIYKAVKSRAGMFSGRHKIHEFGLLKRVGRDVVIVGKAGQTGQEISGKMHRLFYHQPAIGGIMKGMEKASRASGLSPDEAKDMVSGLKAGMKARLDGINIGGTVATGRKGRKAYINRAITREGFKGAFGDTMPLRGIVHHEKFHNIPVVGHSEILAHFVGGLRKTKGKLDPISGIAQVGHAAATRPPRFALEALGALGAVKAGKSIYRSTREKKDRKKPVNFSAEDSHKTRRIPNWVIGGGLAGGYLVSNHLHRQNMDAAMRDVIDKFTRDFQHFNPSITVDETKGDKAAKLERLAKGARGTPEGDLAQHKLNQLRGANLPKGRSLISKIKGAAKSIATKFRGAPKPGFGGLIRAV